MARRKSTRKQRQFEDNHLLFIEANTPQNKFQENKVLMPRNPNQVDAMRGYNEDDGVAHFMNSSLNKTQLKQVREDVKKGKYDNF